MFYRLLPSFTKVAETLPKLRQDLQRDVQLLVKKYGPSLGPVYYDNTGEWEKRYIKAANSAGGGGGGDDYQEKTDEGNNEKTDDGGSSKQKKTD